MEIIMNRPNILLITSDQHRADSLSCYGHPVVHTPHLDQLAYEGLHFDAAYSDCPVCIPARTTMITGRRAYTNGITSYAEHERVKRNREDFLGSLVTRAGYQTQLIGKTHWHTEPYFRGGFESVIWQALMRKEHHQKLKKPVGQFGIGFNELTPGLSDIPPELQLSGWATERAVEFLQLRDRDIPFFLWVSYQDPHPPLIIHEPYYSMYDNCPIPDPVESEWSKDRTLCPRTHLIKQGMMKPDKMPPAQLRKARSVYYGMISHMDHQIGRLLGTLQYLGDMDNTLIIYTSDHGEFLGDHGAGKKNSFMNASSRLPFIISPPQTWRNEPGIREQLGTSTNALVELADLLPTICRAAEAPIPADIDGKSIIPILTGEVKKIKNSIHGHTDDTHMFRDSLYKYIYFTDDGTEMLFDVNDVEDKYAVAVRNPETVTGDTKLLDTYRDLFVKQLEEDRHPDLLSDGSLRNQKLPKPSKREALMMSSQGVRALGWTEFNLRNIQPLH
jgi:arylsulfatase